MFNENQKIWQSYCGSNQFQDKIQEIQIQANLVQTVFFSLLQTHGRNRNQYYENKFLHPKFGAIFNKDMGQGGNSQMQNLVWEVLSESVKTVLSIFEISKQLQNAPDSFQRIEKKLQTVAFLQYVLMYEKVFQFNPNHIVAYRDVVAKLKSYNIA